MAIPALLAAGGGAGAMSAAGGAGAAAGGAGAAAGAAGAGGFWSQFGGMFGKGGGGMGGQQGGGMANMTGMLGGLGIGGGKLNASISQLSQMMRGPTMPFLPHLNTSQVGPNTNPGLIGLASLLQQISARRG